MTDPEDIRAGVCGPCLSTWRWLKATLARTTMTGQAPSHALRPSATEIHRASFGYDPYREIEQDAAEQGGDVCEACAGVGWVDADEPGYDIECPACMADAEAS